MRWCRLAISLHIVTNYLDLAKSKRTKIHSRLSSKSLVPQTSNKASLKPTCWSKSIWLKTTDIQMMQWSEKLRASKKWCKTWQIGICLLAKCYRWNCKTQTTDQCRVQWTQDSCTILTSLAMLAANKEEQKNRPAAISNCPNKTTNKSQALQEPIGQLSQSGKWLHITQLWLQLVPNQEKIETSIHP